MKNYNQTPIRRKMGYDLKQTIFIDLPVGNERINEICKALTKYIPTAEITLDSFLSDTYEYKMKALALAIQNAREKAETMAAALGCTLGPILEVEDNGNQGYGRLYYSIGSSSSADSSGAALEMVGEDEIIDKSVKVIWQLVNPR